MFIFRHLQLKDLNKIQLCTVVLQAHLLFIITDHVIVKSLPGFPGLGWNQTSAPVGL